MKHESNMTSKGQVTVPKDIRIALGLEPGRPVRFELDEDGGARIVRVPTDDITIKRAMLRERVLAAQAIFKANDAFPGMSTDDYMALIREPFDDSESSLVA